MLLKFQPLNWFGPRQMEVIQVNINLHFDCIGYGEVECVTTRNRLNMKNVREIWKIPGEKEGRRG